MMAKHLVLSFCAAVFLLTTPSSLSADEFYTWKDDEGVLHASDTKPSFSDKRTRHIETVRFQFKGVPVGPEFTAEPLEKLRGIEPDKQYSDNFVRLEEKWLKRNEDGGSFRTENMVLFIDAKGGTNLYGERFSAPAIYQPLRNIKNFSLQVSVEYEANSTRNAVGIVLFNNEENKWLSLNFVSKDAVAWKGTEENGDWKSIDMAYTTLKLFRTNGQYYFYYVDDGKWKLLGNIEGEQYDNVGLFAFSWGDQPVTVQLRNLQFVNPATKHGNNKDLPGPLREELLKKAEKPDDNVKKNDEQKN